MAIPPLNQLSATRRNLMLGAGIGTLAAAGLAGCSPASKEAGASGSASEGAPANSGGGVFGAAQSYDLPPVGNFHSLNGVAGALPTRMGYLKDLVLLPGGIYRWHDQSYYYLLADDSSKVSDDELTLEYKVRDGLVWSDDKPITAADVYDTFALRYLFKAPVFKYIKTMEKVDDMTVKFTFNQPSPMATYWVMRERIAPSHVYEEFVEQAHKMLADKVDQAETEVTKLTEEISQKPIDTPVVSGVFNIDTGSMTNSQLKLAKNDKGYKAGDVLWDTIEVYNGGTEAITPLVLAGDVIYATDGFPTATTKQFEDKGYRILRPPVYVGPALFFNFRNKPEFNEKKVRQALAYAMDRPRMGELSLGESGKGPVYLSGISDELIERWVDEETRNKLVAYERDMDKAKSLLEEAGWKKDGDVWTTADGKKAEYKLIYPQDYVDWASAAQEMVSQLNDFGFRITPVGLDSTQQEEDVLKGNYELAIQAWGASNPFPTDAYLAALLTFNDPAAPDTGMGFALKQKTDALGEIDLEQETIDSANGSLEEMVAKTSRLAVAFNELLPIIPMVERYANMPVITEKLTGFPEDGDPIYENSMYSDNFVPILMFEGELKPA